MAAGSTGGNDVFLARSAMYEGVLAALNNKVAANAKQIRKGNIKSTEAEVNQVLKSFPNMNDPTKGYSDLLRISTVAAPVIMVDLIAGSLTTAAMLIADSNEPTYTEATKEEAKEEALQRNFHLQRVLGAKDAVIQWSINVFGKTMVGAVTHTTTGGRRDPDDLQLHEIFDQLKLVTENDTWRQLQTVLAKLAGAKFDFRQTINANHQVMQTMIERLDAAGFPVDPATVALVVLGNAEYAGTKPWGTQFLAAIQEILAAYPPGTKHLDDSLKAILAILAKADVQRNLSSAPSDTTLSDMANAVDILTDELAAEASATDKALGKLRRRESKHRESKPSNRSGRGRSQGRRGKSMSSSKDPKDNPCPHCKKFGRYRHHPNVPESKCFYNKHYKGWRPRDVVDRLNEEYGAHKFTYKPMDELPKSLGGNLDDDDSVGSYVSSEGSVSSADE